MPGFQCTPTEKKLKAAYKKVLRLENIIKTYNAELRKAQKDLSKLQDENFKETFDSGKLTDYDLRSI